MEFFDLFEIPVSLVVDNAAITKKYYALSKEHHPDNFSLQDNEKQEAALEISAKINLAKKILSSPDKRLEYLLREKGIITADEKYQLPPDFLAEMMDINEAAMELEFEPNEAAKMQLKKQVNTLVTALFEEVKTYFEAKELELTKLDAALLKDYYYKKKYLDRIEEKL